MKYSIELILPEDEVWYRVLEITFPSENPPEHNENILHGIIHHLDSTISSGYHCFEEIE